jgi:hypothetical protein
MLTVCIANDMAAKRRGRKQYASIFKKFIGNNFIGKYGSEYKVSVLLYSCSDFFVITCPSKLFSKQPQLCIL